MIADKLRFGSSRRTLIKWESEMIRRNRQFHALFVFNFIIAAMLATIGDVRSQTAPQAGQGIRTAKPPAGMTVRGNQLRAKPGFVLEKGLFSNQLLARPVGGGGGGLGASLNCTCSKEGNCDISASTTVAICHQSTNLPCNGSCEWSLSNSLFGGGFIAR